MKNNEIDVDLANFVLRLVLSDRLPSIATKLLENGYDSPALRMLSGLNESEIVEAIPLFNQAILEIGLSLPSRYEAVLSLAKETAMKILRRDVMPYEGAKIIWMLSLKVDHEICALHPFVYAASEWERIEDRLLFERGIVEEAKILVGTCDGLRCHRPDDDNIAPKGKKDAQEGE